MMALLDREAILKARDLASQDVEIEAWGGSVKVRQFNGLEREAARAKSEEMTDEDFVYWIFTQGVVDDDGTPLFTEADIPDLKKKNATAVMDTVQAILGINGLSKTAEDALEKNSGSGQSVAPGSE